MIPKHLADRRDELAKIYASKAFNPKENEWHLDFETYCYAYDQAVADMLAEVQPLLEALNGLSHGVDWNNGTHAQVYREPLLKALQSWREKFGDEK